MSEVSVELNFTEEEFESFIRSKLNKLYPELKDWRIDYIRQCDVVHDFTVYLKRKDDRD